MPLPHAGRAAACAAVLALVLGGLSSACRGGGGSKKNSGLKRTNIDLAVTDLQVSPSEADPEDTFILTGTVQNLGTEPANPDLGDRFHILFNLSKDGTVELSEEGFLQVAVSDPVPAGDSFNFSYPARFSNGDTLSSFGDFCTSADCTPPEIGVIGTKVDSGNEIAELNEANNFKFVTMLVVGTRVAATFTGCNFGLIGGTSGCDLLVADGFRTVTFHRPSLDPATELVFLNELQRFIQVTLQLKGCTDNSVPNGICGGSWRITTTTQKTGLSPDQEITDISCLAVFGDGPNKACTRFIEIRDPNY